VVRGKIFALFGAEPALGERNLPHWLNAKCQVLIVVSQTFFKKGTS